MAWHSVSGVGRVGLEWCGMRPGGVRRGEVRWGAGVGRGRVRLGWVIVKVGV